MSASSESMESEKKLAIRWKAHSMASAMWYLNELTQGGLRVRIELKNGTRLSDEWFGELSRLLGITPPARLSVCTTTFGPSGHFQAVELCGNSVHNHNEGWVLTPSSTAGLYESKTDQTSCGCSTGSCSAVELDSMFDTPPTLDPSQVEMSSTLSPEIPSGQPRTPGKAGAHYLRSALRLGSMVETLRTQLKGFDLKEHQSRALEESLVALASSSRELKRLALSLVRQEEGS